MDPRTGLGRFRDFRISNYQLMMELIDACTHAERRGDPRSCRTSPSASTSTSSTPTVARRADQALRDRARQPRGARPPRRGGHPPDEPLHDLRAVPRSATSRSTCCGACKQQNTVFATGKSIIDRTQRDERRRADARLRRRRPRGGRHLPGRERRGRARARRACRRASPPTARRRLGSGAVKAPDAHLHRADPVMARLIDDFGGPLPLEPDSRGRPGRAVRRARARHHRAAALREGRRLDLGGCWSASTAHPDARADPRRRPGGAPRRGRVLAREGRATCARSPSTWCPASSTSTGSKSSPTAR